MANTQYQIEDLFAEEPQKKKNSGKKGKRGEYKLVGFLNKRFKDYLAARPEIGGFSRSVGSGNRWGQNVALSRSAKETYLGDLTCPSGFKYVIESKFGYDDIDVSSLFGDRGGKQLDDFLKQAEDASEMTERKPMLCWQKTRKPWMVFMKSGDEPETLSRQICLQYGEWTAYPLEVVFSSADHLYFDSK